MKSLVCEMCNSNDLVKQDGMFVCQSCGTKYTVEEAKKMMIEGTVDVQGTVKVDSSAELANLYELARRANKDNNWENAAKYYDMILVKDPESWEAAFYSVYYQSMQTKIMNIRSALISVDNSLSAVFQLLEKNVTDSKEKATAITDIILSVSLMATQMYNAAKNHYEGIDASIRSKYTDEFSARGNAAINLIYNCGNYIESTFSDPEHVALAVTAWDLGYTLNTKTRSTMLTDNTSHYATKIINLTMANPQYFTKDRLDSTRKLLEDKIATAATNLDKSKNKGKLHARSLLIGAALSAGINLLIYWFYSLFNFDQSSMKIFYICCFIILFLIIYFVAVAASGIPTQSPEELQNVLIAAEDRLKEFDKKINNK